jgi:hypothetical protein
LSRDEIKEAVKEALEESLGCYYLDGETHYQHHEFIEGMIKWMEHTKGTIWGAFLRIMVYGALLLLVGGFIWWGREHIR